MPTSQLPIEGEQDWATPLNQWLGQISPASLGGIHNGDTASRPAGLTADNEGRVYVDTESQELIRWDGSAWQTTLTGNIEQKFSIAAKTADYTITTTEAETGLNGFSNNGAISLVKFTLPDAVAGMKLTVINAEDQTLLVQSVNDDLLYTTDITNGTSNIVNTKKASVAKFYCINDTKWTMNGAASDWTEPHIDTPATLNVTVNNAEDIDLSWADNSDNETGFRIYRSTDGTNFTELDTVGADIVTFKDITASPSTDYWYRVTAYNDITESDPTNTENINSGFGPVGPDDYTASPATYPGQIQVGWHIGGGIVVETNGTTGLIMSPDEYGQLAFAGGSINQTAASYGIASSNESTPDGATNTQNMMDATTQNTDFPAAWHGCAERTINGYSDWFLPTISELHPVSAFVMDPSTSGYTVSAGNFYTSTISSSYGAGRTYNLLGGTWQPSNQSNSRGTLANVLAMRSF